MNNRHASNDESTEERVIMLADGQSFYASVEKSDHPEYANRPLIVAGDPARRSGIVLAACPLAKRFGITTAERLGEALAKCPDVVVVQPRMEHYIAVSLQITRILRNYTDLVEPYSIDEQFLDVTGSQRMFGDPITIARQIQKQVLIETGIYTRIGISFCKVASKMACDNFAKKNDDGVFWLTAAQIQNTLWPLPVQNMFMIGSRMKRHLYRMGIHTIGDLAKTPLARLKNRWGINGEVIWQIANAHDPSPVSPNTHDHQKSFGQQMTLPRDYSQQEEIAVVLLELSEWVCQRARATKLLGHVVSVSCMGADFDHPTGFSRQFKLFEPTNVTDTIYKTALKLFAQHWNGLPIRKIGLTLSDLISTDCDYQLTFFDDQEKKKALERSTDWIKEKYGDTAIMRAVSITPAGQTLDRAKKIGGHYK